MDDKLTAAQRVARRAFESPGLNSTLGSLPRAAAAEGVAPQEVAVTYKRLNGIMHDQALVLYQLLRAAPRGGEAEQSLRRAHEAILHAAAVLGEEAERVRSGDYGGRW